jgi:hypothetical protein
MYIRKKYINKYLADIISITDMIRVDIFRGRALLAGRQY